MKSPPCVSLQEPELGGKWRKEDLSSGAKDDIIAKPKGERDRHHAAQMAQGRLIETVEAKMVGLSSLRQVTIGGSEPDCDPNQCSGDWSGVMGNGRRGM